MIGSELAVAVAEKAQGGKANRALARLLASHLGVSATAVQIQAGSGRARSKRFLVANVAAGDVCAFLVAAITD